MDYDGLNPGHMTWIEVPQNSCQVNLSVASALLEAAGVSWAKLV